MSDTNKAERTEVMAYCGRGIHVQVNGEDEQQFTLDEAREFAKNELDGTERIAKSHSAYEGKYTARSVILRYADSWDSDVPGEEYTPLVEIDDS